MTVRLLGIVVAALVLAASLPPASAQGGPDVGAYTAESIWAAKHATRLDRLFVFGRAPWAEKLCGEGIRIAIIDTGIDLTHPDLRDSLACNACWRDFTGDRSGAKRATPYDDHGHGTHVAGIVAGHGHVQWNPFHFYWGTGMRGAAPDAKLIVAKAMRFDGEGDDATVAAAIRWARDPDGDGDPSDGAHVMNLSLGIEKPEGDAEHARVEVGSRVREAILETVAWGVPVVVSSGNDGADAVTEPGDLPEVITVAATDGDGRLAGFSNAGNGLDLIAPGVLVSTYPRTLDTHDFAGDGYAGMAGTSMAAPLVTGVVALMMQADPALAERGPGKDRSAKVFEIQRVLRQTSKAYPDEPRLGATVGLLDAEAAVGTVDAGPAPVDPVAVVVILVIVGLSVRIAVKLVARQRRRGEEAEDAGADAGNRDRGESENSDERGMT